MRLKDRSILIVEDELIVADCLATIVEEEGGVVLGPVASVAEAFRQLERGRPCAAILDVNLRDGDVTPLAGVLRERGIRFLIHTGGILPSRLRDAIGQAPVLSKPSSYETLVLTLRGLITDDSMRTASEPTPEPALAATRRREAPSPARHDDGCVPVLR